MASKKTATSIDALMAGIQSQLAEIAQMEQPAIKTAIELLTSPDVLKLSETLDQLAAETAGQTREQIGNVTNVLRNVPIFLQTRIIPDDDAG